MNWIKLSCKINCRQMVLKLDNNILPPIYRYPEAEVHLVHPVMDVAKLLNNMKAFIILSRKIVYVYKFHSRCN